MSELFLLGFQVVFIVCIPTNFNWNVFNDFQSVTNESGAFFRVVRHESDFLHAQIMQNLCSDSVLALITLETEFFIGFNCVVTFFL